MYHIWCAAAVRFPEDFSAIEVFYILFIIYYITLYISDYFCSYLMCFYATFEIIIIGPAAPPAGLCVLLRVNQFHLTQWNIQD